MSLVADTALSAREFLDECIAFKREHAPQSHFLRGLVTRQARPRAARALGEGLLLLRRARHPDDCRLAVDGADPARPRGVQADRPQPRRRDGLHQGGRAPRSVPAVLRRARHHARRLLEHTPLASTIGAASTMGYYCRNSFEEGLGAFGLGVEMDVPGRPNGAQGDLRRPRTPLRHRREGDGVLGDPRRRPRRSTARTPRRRSASAARRASSRPASAAPSASASSPTAP